MTNVFPANAGRFTYPRIAKYERRDVHANGTATLAVARYPGQPDHLSLTGSFWEAGESRNDRSSIGAGACHDLIVAAFPQLAEAAKYHLHEIPSGAPVHTESNLRYWFGLSSWRRDKFSPMPADAVDSEPFTVETDSGPIDSSWSPGAAARHLVTDIETARQHHAYVLTQKDDSTSIRFVVNCHRSRWAKEMAAIVDAIPEQ